VSFREYQVRELAGSPIPETWLLVITAYWPTSASTPEVVPLLAAVKAPMCGRIGRVAGVAYLTLTVHVALGASGVANEQVFAVTLKNVLPAVMLSPVICNGAVPVFVIVTTLVTAARGDGIVNESVCTPKIFASDPFVADVKLSVPAVTVKVTVLLVPPGVVTLTVLADTVAVPEIVNVAVTVVALTTVTLLTVMPVPDTFTADVPVRFVPVKVTGTATPRPELAGEIEVSVGNGTLAPNSTAPTSTEPLVFLKVPKKSSLGATE
jgi:hypothetical protein